MTIANRFKKIVRKDDDDLLYELPDGGKSSIPPESTTNINTVGTTNITNNNNRKGNGNGNGHAKQDLVLQELETPVMTPEAEQMLNTLNSAMNQSTEDKTKFTLLASLRDETKLKFYTEFLDKNDVYKMNKLEMVSKMIPMIYGSALEGGKDNDVLKSVMQLLEDHLIQHRTNMVSYKRKGEQGMIHALRNDSSVTQVDSRIKKMFGGKA